MVTKVTTNLIDLLAVATGNLADVSVTAGKIAPDAVVTSKVLDRNITTAKIALNGVTAAEIADDAVIERHYADVSIPTAAYKDASVTGAKLGVAAVGATNINAGAVQSSHIGDDQITQNHYADGSIQTPHYGDASVTTAKVAPNAITTDKLQAFTANRLMYSNVSGVLDVLPSGSEGQVLSITGGALGWGNAAIPTGVMLPYFGTTAPSGWVISDGSTIGSTASAANIKSDTFQALFLFLWNSFPNSVVAVTGGRGVSAAADWAANKAIATPDMRGRTPIGVEVGETSSGRLDPAIIDTGSAIQVGSVGGADKIALTTDEIPSHSHLLFVDGEGVYNPANKTSTNAVYTNGDNDNDASYQNTYSSTYITPTVGKSGLAGTGSAPTHRNMPPFMLVNYILKV